MGGAGKDAAGSGAPTEAWDWLGWGTSTDVTLLRNKEGRLVSADALAAGSDEAAAATPSDGKSKKKAAVPHVALDQFRATSIAGNDLLSSCLYSANVTAVSAGKLAPIALALVAFMLYFFRGIYAEVVSALPANGGCYNALLNTSSKGKAAVAACLSIISYIATAVISAFGCVGYLQAVWPDLDLKAGTIVVLAIFAALCLIGVSESAGVATAIFTLHITTLTILVIWGFVYAFNDGWNQLAANWAEPYPTVVTPHGTFVAPASAGNALYFGYSAALLGITGFESAANFVEEMKDAKTYVSTVRNMWIGAALFNPLISFIAMAVMPLYAPQGQPSITGSSSDLLAQLAFRLGGERFKTLLAIDGAVVLAGAVLTSYVGVVGLVKRMTLDRCFPAFLAQANKWRGSNHWIILSFLGLNVVLFLASSGDLAAALLALSEVYALAFLSVMTAFAAACMVLKWKRPDLPRLSITSWPQVTLSMCAVVVGLIGVIVKGYESLLYFFLYLLGAGSVVAIMFNRVRLLKFGLRIAYGCLRDKEARARTAARKTALEQAHVRTEAQRQRRGSMVVGIVITPEMLAEADAEGMPLEPHKGCKGTLGAGCRAAAAALTCGRCCTGSTLPPAGKPRATSEGGDSVADGASTPKSAFSGGGSVVGASSSASGGGTSRGVRMDLPGWRGRVLRYFTDAARRIASEPVVFFTKNADLSVLNKAILYVRDNEQASQVYVVHVVDDRDAIATLAASSSAVALSLLTSPLKGRPGTMALPSNALATAVTMDAVARTTWSTASLAVNDTTAALSLLSSLPPPGPKVQEIKDAVSLLDAVYPKTRINCLVIRGSYFCPSVVRWLSGHLHIPPNMMFMSMPDERFPHQISALGGVRLIARGEARAVRHRNEDHLKEVLERVATDVVSGIEHQHSLASGVMGGISVSRPASFTELPSAPGSLLSSPQGVGPTLSSRAPPRPISLIFLEGSAAAAASAPAAEGAAAPAAPVEAAAPAEAAPAPAAASGSA